MEQTTMRNSERRGRVARAACLGTLALLTLGCGTGTVQCTQPCEQSSDCEGDLLCVNSARGFICLPNACDACFEAGRTCSYTTSGSLSDETFLCTAPYCN